LFGVKRYRKEPFFEIYVDLHTILEELDELHRDVGEMKIIIMRKQMIEVVARIMRLTQKGQLVWEERNPQDIPPNYNSLSPLDHKMKRCAAHLSCRAP